MDLNRDDKETANNSQTNRYTAEWPIYIQKKHEYFNLLRGIWVVFFWKGEGSFYENIILIF